MKIRDHLKSWLTPVKDWSNVVDKQVKDLVDDFAEGTKTLSAPLADLKRRRAKKLSRRDVRVFEKKLKELLVAKAAKYSELGISGKDLKRLSAEMTQCLLYSLTSRRTPEEIINALRDDLEMRDEVVEMILSRSTGSEATRQTRVFLNILFSGDRDLLSLLNSQKGNNL
ncbi:MAG: hypothetical protein HQM16_10190 [Deltaproteobacteria bacterium]|nr:hypothetical protein [Deltaproteobacteria bacterium]